MRGAVRRVKLAAVYLSMTLLCLIFAVLLVRSLLALVTWVALGRCLWLFPFLLSEVQPKRVARQSSGRPLALVASAAASAMPLHGSASVHRSAHGNQLPGCCHRKHG